MKLVALFQTLTEIVIVIIVTVLHFKPKKKKKVKKMEWSIKNIFLEKKLLKINFLKFQQEEFCLCKAEDFTHKIFFGVNGLS